MKYIPRLKRKIIKQLYNISHKYDKNIKIAIKHKKEINAYYDPSNLCIILNYSLFSKFTKREILSIFYHELAHAIDPKVYIGFNINSLVSLSLAEYQENESLFFHEREYHADRLGLQLRHDPSAVCRSFNKLSSFSDLAIDQDSYYHPSFIKRLAALNLCSVL